jgi:hypothetical protein
VTTEGFLQTAGATKDNTVCECVIYNKENYFLIFEVLDNALCIIFEVLFPLYISLQVPQKTTALSIIFTDICQLELLIGA